MLMAASLPPMRIRHWKMLPEAIDSKFLAAGSSSIFGMVRQVYLIFTMAQDVLQVLDMMVIMSGLMRIFIAAGLAHCCAP
jgi:hypothetical protein